MSYQEPYTFDERKDIRKLKGELVHLFSIANDEEIEDWLTGYMAETKDLITLLRTLLSTQF